MPAGGGRRTITRHPAPSVPVELSLQGGLLPVFRDQCGEIQQIFCRPLPLAARPAAALAARSCPTTAYAVVGPIESPFSSRHGSASPCRLPVRQTNPLRVDSAASPRGLRPVFPRPASGATRPDRCPADDELASQGWYAPAVEAGVPGTQLPRPDPPLLLSTRP